MSKDCRGLTQARIARTKEMSGSEGGAPMTEGAGFWNTLAGQRGGGGHACSGEESSTLIVGMIILRTYPNKL